MRQDGRIVGALPEADDPGSYDEKSRIRKRRWRLRVEGNRDKTVAIPVGPGHRQFWSTTKRLAQKRLDPKALDKPARWTSCGSATAQP